MPEKLFFKRSYYLIAVGMFFLINPLINIVDILPDVFGYILIFFGITEFGLIDGKMESARRKIEYLMVVSVLKHVLMFPVMTGLNSDKLLATFSFAIVELPLLIFFCIDFFEGLSYLAERDDGKETDLLIPNVKFISILFFTIKIGLSILPELYSLVETKMAIEVTNYDAYERFLTTQPYARAFTILVVLVLGIFWYINFVRMLHTAKRETTFTQKLQERYAADYLSYPEKQSFKILKSGLYTALFGCIFFLDIAVDGVRVLPNALAILILWISAYILRKLGSFRMTLRAAPFALLIQIFTEVYRQYFIDVNLVFLTQLELPLVLFSAAVTIINSCVTIVFLILFVSELQKNYQATTAQEAPTFDLVKSIFLSAMVVKMLQIILPSLHEETSALFLILSAVWIVLCGKGFFNMINDYDHSLNLR